MRAISKVPGSSQLERGLWNAISFVTRPFRFVLFWLVFGYKIIGTSFCFFKKILLLLLYFTEEETVTCLENCQYHNAAFEESCVHHKYGTGRHVFSDLMGI